MKTIVKIDGMCCERCAKRVEEKLSVAKNVVSVDVKFKKKIAIIRSREEVFEEEIKQIVNGAGYTFVSMQQK